MTQPHSEDSLSRGTAERTHDPQHGRPEGLEIGKVHEQQNQGVEECADHDASQKKDVGVQTTTRSCSHGKDEGDRGRCTDECGDRQGQQRHGRETEDDRHHSPDGSPTRHTQHIRFSEGVPQQGLKHRPRDSKTGTDFRRE